MKLTTFSKSRIKFDNSSAFPTENKNRWKQRFLSFMARRVLNLDELALLLLLLNHLYHLGPSILKADGLRINRKCVFTQKK